MRPTVDREHQPGSKISGQETGTSDATDLRLIHANCRHGSGKVLRPAYKPTGLA